MPIFGIGNFDVQTKGMLTAFEEWVIRMYEEVSKNPLFFQEYDIPKDCMDYTCKGTIWSALAGRQLKDIPQEVPDNLKGDSQRKKEGRLNWTKDWLKQLRTAMHSGATSFDVLSKLREHLTDTLKPFDRSDGQTAYTQSSFLGVLNALNAQRFQTKTKS